MSPAGLIATVAAPVRLRCVDPYAVQFICSGVTHRGLLQARTTPGTERPVTVLAK